MTWPRPTRELLEETYSSREYYVSRNMDDGAWESTTLRARDVLEQAGCPARRALDFGAGEGHLVEAFRSLGIEADGVEPSEAGRAEARRRYGIDLWESLPETCSRPRDLVVLLHSLEHVFDPVTTLRQLSGWLHTGGRILIEVPNVASFEMLRPQRRRWILTLPLHLYHFTPETLATVVTAAGFEVVGVRLTNPDWLEWAFALRARLRASRPKGHVLNDAPVSQKENGIRHTWRQSAVPWIRRRCPGWTFQLVARPAAARTVEASKDRASAQERMT